MSSHTDTESDGEQAKNTDNSAATSVLSAADTPVTRETDEEKTKRLALLRQVADPVTADKNNEPEEQEPKIEVPDRATQEEVDEALANNPMGLPNHAIVAAIKARKIAEAKIAMDTGEHDQNSVRAPENLPQGPNGGMERS